MPTLTGTLDSVTGGTIDPDQIRRAYIRAPKPRASLGTQQSLVTTVPVPVSTEGQLSVDLDPGPAVLVVETITGGPDVYELGVTEDMTLLTEALNETIPNRSWVESQMVQLRGQAVEAAGQAVDAAGQAEAAEERVEVEHEHVHQDVEHVDGVAAHVAGLLDQANTFAQDQVPPYLQQQVLNSTYAALPSAGTYAREGVGTPVSVTSGMQALAHGPTVLTVTPTYEGSGESTHPSVLYIPEGFGGYSYWMGMTPYPGADSSKENPSILASHDGIEWVVPDGLTNPIFNRPTDHSSSFNADTHLVCADGWLYCYWRAIMSSSVDEYARIYYRRSRDGVVWEEPVQAWAGRQDEMIVSPSVAYDPASRVWTMWPIRTTGETTVERWTADAPHGPWSEPETCTGFDVGRGMKVWHMSVGVFGGEYVAFAHCTPGGQSVIRGALFRFTSPDGVNFTPDRDPFVFSEGVYRPCAIPATVDGKPGYRLWHGDVQSNVWRIAHTLVTLHEPGIHQRRLRDALAGLNGEIVDTFNRPDSIDTVGTPTVGPTAWEPAASWFNKAGIIDHQMYFPSLTTMVAGAIDGDVEVGCTVTEVAADGQIFLHARNQGAYSYFRAGFLSGGGTVRFDSRIDSTDVFGRGSGTRPGGVPFLVAGDTMRLRIVGSTVSMFVNEEPVMIASGVQLPETGRVGISANREAFRVDNFYAIPL